MNESHLAWIALNRIPMRPLHRVRLAELCGGPVEVFRQGRERLGRIAWIRPQTKENIVNSDWKSIALREIETANRHGIHIFSMNMDIFPSPLMEMPDPPVVLYVRGDLSDSDLESIAVVGPRRPTTYGRMMAEELGRDLAAAGVTVVSGLAEGVDAAAHEGALACGGRTVAFLGSGLDHPYPRANRRLRERIPESGAVISEFPLGTEPRAWHFPQRNRLIAGLSRGTVVVEAARKSGALITAEHAMELGREVFAVPGPVTSDRSEGTLALLRDGATLVRSAADVLEELPGFRQRPGAPQAAAAQALPDLPEEEARVLGHLEPGAPQPVDVLARLAGVPIGALLDALVSLEVRRLVRSLPGGRYVRPARRA